MNYPLPPYLLQSAPGQESDCCTTFSLANLVYMLTGFLPSMRALAIDADLMNPNNRNVENVLTIANEIGLVAYSDCPLPVPFTVASFFNFNTSKLKKQKLNIQLVPANLAVSPIWTELAWGTNLPEPTRHMAPMISATEFVDSESGGQIKNIDKPSIFGASPATIVWQSSIKINNKPIMNETVVALSKDGKTVYKCTPVATDWPNFVKQAGVEGITIPAILPPTSSL